MSSVQYCYQVMVIPAWWLNCKEPGIADPVDKHASGISDEWTYSHIPW